MWKVTYLDVLLLLRSEGLIGGFDAALASLRGRLRCHADCLKCAGPIDHRHDCRRGILMHGEGGLMSRQQQWMCRCDHTYLGHIIRARLDLTEANSDHRYVEHAKAVIVVERILRVTVTEDHGGDVFAKLDPELCM